MSTLCSLQPGRWRDKPDAPSRSGKGEVRPNVPTGPVRGKGLIVKIEHGRATRAYIERSPFICLATSAPGGECGVSPRGDPPGFVRILDDRTLLLPERPGNKIADSLRNIIGNPHVGILFIIPGVGETFRVNGKAVLIDDAELLAEPAIEGKVPKLGIRVRIEEAYTQCPKAFIRSDLWNVANHLSSADFASGGEILRVINGAATFDAEAYDAALAERYAQRDGFY
jgi:uncharacterized protein